MASAITMPKMGLTMKEGTVNLWHKAEGETVQHDEDLVEIANDKVTHILQSPEDGVLLKILVPDGEVVPVGAVLGWVGVAGEQIPETGPAAATAGAPGSGQPAVASATAAREGHRGGLRISPAARKLAEAHGLDIANVAGTGPGGRITREDVERAIAAQ